MRRAYFKQERIDRYDALHFAYAFLELNLSRCKTNKMLIYIYNYKQYSRRNLIDV